MGSDADVQWFTVEAGVVIHTANAWEEGDDVIIQACRSKTSDVIGAGEVDTDDPTDVLGQLYQWRINLATGDIVEGPLHEHFSDFSRINENYNGVANRYVYSAEFDQTRSITFKNLMKFDNQTGETQRHIMGEGRYTGEAVFAPKVGAVDEDDGYLITFIQDENTNQSECIIIDAKDFAGEPVARILIPHRVPYGFHAGWVGT
jgi:carotenoid cleavage dioxygenase